MVVSGPRPRPAGPTRREAFAWCREYTRAHQENFAVVTWLLPRALRLHFYSIYAFCRSTDDLGDEAEGDRLALLNRRERELRLCYEGVRESPLFVALGATIDRFAIPSEPFLRLIEANRMDQRKSRFATYDDLLFYCEHSATPVGRMVLYVLGYRDDRRQRLADAVCVGLQLANFWQDVSVDAAKGRIYVPQEDLARFGVGEVELFSGSASPAFRELMRFEVGRARALFVAGAKLERLVDRRARLDVRLFRLGGEAVLDAIEEAGYDVLRQRPTIPRARRAWIAVANAIRLKTGL